MLQRFAMLYFVLLCVYDIPAYREAVPFSATPPVGLLGGAGGNDFRSQLARTAAWTCRRSQPKWTVPHICRFLNAEHPTYNFTINTLQRWFRQPAYTTTVRTHGGHNITSPELRRRIIGLLRGTSPLKKGLRQNRHSVCGTVRKINHDEKTNFISETTVRRVATAEGLRFRHRSYAPQITPANRIDREAFYERHRGRSREQWRQIVWSDSHAISPSHVPNIHNDGVWMFDHDPPPPPFPRLRRPQSTLHCYGALTRFGLLGPVFIVGGINAPRYVKEVLSELIKLVKAAFGEAPFTFQQDGASAHRANTTQDWLEASEISYIGRAFWPGNSPDINVIEGFWPQLQDFCAPPGQYDIPHKVLKQRATLFFKRQTPEICCSFLDSSKGRMALLRKHKFWAIGK